ncbi:arginine-hydroxylase NDUFAF5, mitochondrial-like [Liolophura sinensis]|uniref:arginine-hydroxylase NDUFAF5, mitochondrial-like n=1 Tax=Liolophura sinensis TaxID=3198878 RepID=UPI003158441C
MTANVSRYSGGLFNPQKHIFQRIRQTADISVPQRTYTPKYLVDAPLASRHNHLIKKGRLTGSCWKCTTVRDNASYWTINNGKKLNYLSTTYLQRRSFSLHSRNDRPESVMNVFDRKVKRVQRDRTTLLEDYEVYDYVKEEVGFRLADRICDVKRVFDIAVELGCGRGYISRHMTSDIVKKVLQCEMSEKLLLQSKISADVPTHRIMADEEFIPFKDNSLDLVVSSLSLHWVNDLPGCFRQIHNALKSDGVLLGSMFGGDTLYQLRGALQLAETEREGGFGSHISPFTEIRDLGNLLNRAGFTMLTIDVDELNITYPTMFELMTDLKGMGENNCSWSRKLHLHRDTMMAAASIYKDMYGTERGVPATFQILYFIGWKPGKNQAKAAERGSANVSFKDLDKFNQLVKEVGKVGKSKSAEEKLDQFAEELHNKGDNPDSSR